MSTTEISIGASGPPAGLVIRKRPSIGDRSYGRPVTPRPGFSVVNSFVTAPIAREFGVEHLIATEPETLGGRFTGKVSGVPSFREGKVARLHAWLAARGRRLEDFAERYCYSDSHNDLPLLALATRPVAVDPDPQLAAEASRRGWPAISLKSPA